MKKLFGMIAALAMSVTCLTACGGGSEDAFVGKWECKEMKMEGMTISDEFMGIPVAAMIQVEFKDDKTGVATAMGEEEGKFDWEADGDKVTVEIDGEKTTFTKDGDLITMTSPDDDSQTVVLQKVDNFTEFDASALEDGDLDLE